MNHLSYGYDSEQGKNDYVPTDVHWSEVPVEMMVVNKRVNTLNTVQN